MKRFFISYFLCVIILLSACTRENAEINFCNRVTYSQHIKPIIMDNCAVSGCHVQNFQPGDFTSYEGIKTKYLNGTLQLMLFERNLMPPVKKLTAQQMTMMKCWVDQGAKNN